jgi:hypothetical protein
MNTGTNKESLYGRGTIRARHTALYLNCWELHPGFIADSSPTAKDDGEVRGACAQNGGMKQCRSKPDLRRRTSFFPK